MKTVCWSFTYTLLACLWLAVNSTLAFAQTEEGVTALSEQAVGSEKELPLTMAALRKLIANYPGIAFNSDYEGIYPTQSEAEEQLDYLISLPDALTIQPMMAQLSESVISTSSQSTYKIYRACHSFNHDIYGEIRHDSWLTVDSVYNSFLDATHDISPHWRNIIGTDLDWVETSRWDYSHRQWLRMVVWCTGRFVGLPRTFGKGSTCKCILYHNCR